MKIFKYSLVILCLTLLACGKNPVAVTDQTDAKVVFRQSGLDRGMQCTIRMYCWDGSEQTGTYSAGEGVSLEGGDLHYKGVEGASFVAYSPAGSSVSDGILSFSVDQDQSKALEQNDLLTGFASVHKATLSSVLLNFSHRLSDIEIVFRDLGIQNAVFGGLCTDAVWDFASNSIALSEQSRIADVVMFKDGNCFRAIVPSQTVPAGAVITVTDEEGKEYSYTFAEEIRLSEGRRFILYVNKSFSGGGLEGIHCEIDAPWHGETGIDSWI